MALKDKLSKLFVQSEQIEVEVVDEKGKVEKAPTVVEKKKSIINVDLEGIKQKGRATKKQAINKFTDAVDKEKEISRKITFWALVYDIVITVLYVVITIASVFTKWSDASNPLIMTFLLAAYVVAFGVMTIYTIKGLKESNGESYKKRNAVKNYKSAANIVKKVMKAISVGLSIFLAIEAWDSNGVFKIMSLILIFFSVISLIKVLLSIGKEVKKIKKRQNAKESKVSAIKRKIENYSDELKKKNAEE